MRSQRLDSLSVSRLSVAIWFLEHRYKFVLESTSCPFRWMAENGNTSFASSCIGDDRAFKYAFALGLMNSIVSPSVDLVGTCMLTPVQGGKAIS